DARVAAPERGRPGAGDGRPRGPGLGERCVDLVGRADVVGQGPAAPPAAVLDPAVGGEFPAVPQGQDGPWRLEEGDVVGLVVHAPAQVPAERLVERPGARDVADAEGDEAQPLVHGYLLSRAWTWAWIPCCLSSRWAARSSPSMVRRRAGPVVLGAGGQQGNDCGPGQDRTSPWHGGGAGS